MEHRTLRNEAMPLLNSLAKVVAKPLPRMLTPKAHAVVDYVTAASFLIGAGLFWHRNKRATLAALICGGSKIGVSLLTDYPGGVTKVIGFRTRREIDLGLAAMIATMPEFLAFKDDSARTFFLAQGALIAASTELTQLPEKVRRGEKGIKRTKAA
jgi:hypothetical protein